MFTLLNAKFNNNKNHKFDKIDKEFRDIMIKTPISLGEGWIIIK